MTQKIKALVVKSKTRKEKDKDILLFSVESGKIWATLKGVKSAGAKMKLAQNPFTFGEFVLEDGKFGRIVTSFECIESFHELSEDVDKYFAASAVLEVLDALDFSGNCSQIFVLAMKTLKNICFKETNPIYFLDKFLIEFFKISGLCVYSSKCSSCGAEIDSKVYVDFSDGRIVCGACKNFSSEEISAATFKALKILSENEFEKLSTIKLSPGSETSLLRVLAKNFDARFDKKLKFLGILS